MKSTATQHPAPSWADSHSARTAAVRDQEADRVMTDRDQLEDGHSILPVHSCTDRDHLSTQMSHTTSWRASRTSYPLAWVDKPAGSATTPRICILMVPH